MKSTVLSAFNLAVCLGFLYQTAQAEDKSSEADSAVPWKLLFSNSQDISDTWGTVHFGVTPVRLVREVEPPDFSFGGAFPLKDGNWEVFGQQTKEIKPGNEPWLREVSWRLVRATTRDGVKFENQEVVFECPGPWTSHFAIARNGNTGEYLVLKLKVDNSGFAYTAFFSPDGKQWQEHESPLFYDGDAMSLYWSPALHRFVCTSKSLQPFRKHIIDHGGPTPRLGDDTLRDRRVLMIRTSPDGRRWEPSVSMSDVWNRNGRKDSIPAGFMIMPDKEDPVDLEFYSGSGFWYYDRAYMMVLNYAGSPLAPRQHAPHLDNEWWTSPDGLHWQRPARGLNVLEAFPKLARIETHPLVADGMILFPSGSMLLGMPEDRISYVGARANAEFSTVSFKMPAGDLFLNAASPTPDRPFAKMQAYVMVAVLDDQGQTIPGYERDKCLIREEDRCQIPLKWENASARQLAGRNVRLRFSLRSANIYAVTCKN